MKLCWLIPIAFLFPSLSDAMQNQVGARVATVTISPNEVTVLHLRPEFESSIRMPEEITSVILGSPGIFKAEHNEGEPELCLRQAGHQGSCSIQSAGSDQIRSARYVGAHQRRNTAGTSQPVDFLLEYRGSRSFLIGPTTASGEKSPEKPPSAAAEVNIPLRTANLSAIELELAQQERVNSPAWTKWNGKQIETSIGDIRQWRNQTIVSYSIYNDSSQPVEIVPPQIWGSLA